VEDGVKAEFATINAPMAPYISGRCRDHGRRPTARTYLHREGAVVKMGAKIYGRLPSALVAKSGGEINNVVSSLTATRHMMVLSAILLLLNGAILALTPIIQT